VTVVVTVVETVVVRMAEGMGQPKCF
jgi:hypothetical protein